MRNNFVKIIGYVLTFLSFYYIYLSFKKLDFDWINLLELINGGNAMLVFAAFLIYLIVLYISAAFWSYLVQYFSGLKNNINGKLIKVYAKSNIGKYLPGNFMQFVGRNILAYKLGYKHSVIILSSVYEIVYVLLIGLIVLVMMMMFNLSEISLQESLFLSHEKLDILLLFGILIVILIGIYYKNQIVHYVQQNKIISKLKNSLLFALGVFLIVYILLGVANFLLLSIFMDNISMKDYFNILFVFVVSWIVGFVMPGMPGGIGVREALFIFLLSQKYDILVVTLIPIIFRLINILGDVFFFALSSIKIKDSNP